MTCKQCRRENNEQSHFCGRCGAQLDESSDEHRTLVCPECHSQNNRGSRNCSQCGTSLGHHGADHRPKHGHDHDQPKKKLRRNETKGWTHPFVLAFLIVSGVSLVFYVVAINTIQKRQERPARIIEAKSNDQVLEAKVMDVASRFICSCGTCGEKPLEICKCNTAVEERQYIRSLLQSGQSLDEVTSEVNDKYGWAKPEFSASPDSGSLGSGRSRRAASNSGELGGVTLRVPEKDGIGLLTERPSPLGNAVIATVADRMEVFSHFKCPCGQCGIDELKDCECNHPRGATEVKDFVDGKIREQRFTVAQLIDEVENRYGNRKNWD